MGRIFCDTNIFIAALRGEKQEAELLFERALSCEFTIIYNDRIELEVMNKYPELVSDLEGMLKTLQGKGRLEAVKVQSIDIRDALRFMRDLKMQQANLGYEDCLFGILAKKNKCILVSEDKKLVENLRRYKFNARKLSFFFHQPSYL